MANFTEQYKQVCVYLEFYEQTVSYRNSQLDGPVWHCMGIGIEVSSQEHKCILYRCLGKHLYSAGPQTIIGTFL